MEPCTECHGSGKFECVAYYYGVVECDSCLGTGVDITSLTPDERYEWGLDKDDDEEI